MTGHDYPDMPGLLKQQFVQRLTIADLYNPSEFRAWRHLLEIEQWPNLALVVRVQPIRHSRLKPGFTGVASEQTLLLSDRLKSSLRMELNAQLMRLWPNLLCNWQEDLELVALLTSHNLVTKSNITDTVSSVLKQISLPLASSLYAGVSRTAENISLLSAAIRLARQAAAEAERERQLLLHVDDIEVFYNVQKGGPDSLSERQDLTLVNPLESEIRQTREVLLAYRQPTRVSLDSAKRKVLEQLVGLMNACRTAGIAIDGDELIDTGLFESLIKANTVSKLALWVEKSGFVFLNRLSGLAEQSQSRIIQEAISYLTEHLHEDLSLENIAFHCNVSHYYLSHLFRKETGTTVTAFVKKARIDQAMVLLRDSSSTIAEVAYKVGYQDPNYFSKSFRSYIGVSPTEFRNL